MKFTCTTPLLSLILGSASGFVSHSVRSFRRVVVPLTPLRSTLAPAAPDVRVADDDSPGHGALSMQIDELAEVLGGRGRAQIVWDCYSIVSVEQIR
jgi:hypothetical protein